MKIYDDNIGEVVLIDSMGSDKTVVNSARVSYGKDIEELNDKDIKLIKYLYDHKHTTPFESCMMTFRFTVPLFVRSQHHRHRTWKFNELSRRYTSDNLQFYLPKKWRVQSDSSKQASEVGDLDHVHQSHHLEVHCKKSLELYNDMLGDGVAKEMARMVLPQNLYTVYYGTIDLKNAIDFLRLRLHPHAQLEIRLVAEAMQTIMRNLFPETMKLVNFSE